MTESYQYGRTYYRIGLTDVDKTEVSAYADEVKLEPSGALVLLGRFSESDSTEPLEVLLAFGPGQWAFVYAADMIDGAAMNVERWPGQIKEQR